MVIVYVVTEKVWQEVSTDDDEGEEEEIEAKEIAPSEQLLATTEQV